MPGNIYLTGFMGAGKTSVGRILAERLGMEFWDTDAVVVEQTGRPIREIFAQAGEEGFRGLESKAIAEIARKRRRVVALGGGAPLREENWKTISATGVTVYLKEAQHELLARLTGDETRPLLVGYTKEERLGRIRGLLSAREPYYLRADIVVECRGRPPEEIARDILAELEDEDC